MSTLSSMVNYLDNVCYGENGHLEQTWSTNAEDKLVQLFFQLVRDFNDKSKYVDLLRYVFLNNKVDKEFLKLVLKLVAHTRDIVAGKGEYQLSYMLIEILACPKKYDYTDADNGKKCIECSMFILNSFVKLGDEHPLGSWKDFKYFLSYFKEQNPNDYLTHPVFIYIINMYVHQLKIDVKQFNKNESISMVAKWIPREGSKQFGWIMPYIAHEYYANQYFTQHMDTLQQFKANKKAVTHLRQLLANLNRYIDTVQIKQCGRQYSSIDFNTGVTSITMSKQKHAFSNINKKNGETKYPDNKDRILCAKHYADYIAKCSNGKNNIKGKRVSIYNFVKDALQQGADVQNDITKTINLQWDEQGKLLNSSFDNLLAMVDVSGSMTCDNNQPMFNAIGLGIRIAERSSLGNRVMTFSKNPSWVKFDNNDSFIKKVHKVSKAEWGRNTDFYKAFDLILEAYNKYNVSPENAKNFGFVVLSDMQIDYAHQNTDYRYKHKNLQEVMCLKFKNAGFPPPTIIFWNLRKTNGFPTVTTVPNTVMISGFSPVMLNIFADKGVDGLKTFTPINMLKNLLNNERYNLYNNFVHNCF